jgi:hypothetical protein
MRIVIDTTEQALFTVDGKRPGRYGKGAIKVIRPDGIKILLHLARAQPPDHSAFEGS